MRYRPSRAGARSAAFADDHRFLGCRLANDVQELPGIALQAFYIAQYDLRFRVFREIFKSSF